MSERDANIESQASDPPSAEGGDEAASGSTEPTTEFMANLQESKPEILKAEGSVARFEDRTLGDFRILRRLGRGGMAEVYLAEQTSLKRNVALKVLRDEWVGDETHLSRFAREAKAAAGLHHPNIVQVFAVGEEAGVHFIAQEYVQGRNLREFLTREGIPQLPAALHIIKQVAAALQAAGEAGIVHRDIKPENIMITPKLQVKVTDFGLAQLSESGERVNLTQVGITMGTPLYMSPEQVNGKKLDQRSDIYSLGVTCYHLLAGRPPFRGETALAIAVQHLNSDAIPLFEQRSDLPPLLGEIVAKMMAKDPKDRYANAEAVLADVKRLEEGWADSFAGGNWDELSWSGRGRSLSIWRNRRLQGLALMCLSASVVSAWAGASMRPENPLDTQVKSEVQRAETAFDQLWLALKLQTEEGYRAVVVNFEGSQEAYQASYELALLQLFAERYDQAYESFDRASSPQVEHAPLRAQGIAGRAVIASRQGRYRDSQNTIHIELEGFLKKNPLARERLDPRMRELIAEASEFNSEHLGLPSKPSQKGANSAAEEAR
ncbi:MAG: hypothetical protein CMJ48_08835 [Planctomycetaceae bacterium]|nr:hypothetical protein [Planctomycetaceae bacterium]